jgi:hypothetical protein
VAIQAQSTKDYASILQPPDTQTAKKVPNSRLLLPFQCMPISSPKAESSQDVVSSEHPQLLLVCLLLGLIFCGGIVLYTNQVKGQAALLAQDSYAGGPAADMVPPSNIKRSSPVPGTVSIDRSQHSDASLNVTRNKQPGIANNRKSATDHPFDALSLAHGKPGRNELAAQRAPLSKSGLRKLLPPPAARGSSSLTPSRNRFRNSFSSHHRTTLVALWRQSLKRHQTDKLSHLTSNPST